MPTLQPRPNNTIIEPFDLHYKRLSGEYVQAQKMCLFNKIKTLKNAKKHKVYLPAWILTKSAGFIPQVTDIDYFKV